MHGEIIDSTAALNAFLISLRSRAGEKSPLAPENTIYHLAMAVGQPGLHGFAPFRDMPHRLMKRPKTSPNIGEPATLVSRARYADSGNDASNARPSWAAQAYEKNVAQARGYTAEALISPGG